MAVEARQINPFPPQLIQERDLLSPPNQGDVTWAYGSQQMRLFGNPFAAALPESQCLYPPVVCDSVRAKASINTDSDLTYNISAPRKRSRDSVNQLYATPNFTAVQKSNGVPPFTSLPGEDMLPQIQQFQLEIDAIVSQHAKKIRLELEERQKQQARLLTAAIGEEAMRKLKEKDKQIQRMGKLNLALQERVKNLYVENQFLRDLAQTSEATANSLRTNLEQVLLHVGGEEHVHAGTGGGDAAAFVEDVESCCGSSDVGRIPDGGHAEDEGEGGSRYNDRSCRKCGERESCVLLLPCRHLCLCGVCGSGSHQLQVCPVCNSSMNATLHVNLSC